MMDYYALVLPWDSEINTFSEYGSEYGSDDRVLLMSASLGDLQAECRYTGRYYMKEVYRFEIYDSAEKFMDRYDPILVESWYPR